MKNKTCGECKHYIAEMFHCQKNDVMAEVFNTCEDFEPEVITNGDKIRQGGNRELAEFLWKLYNGHICSFCVFIVADDDRKKVICKRPPDKTCTDGIEAWLNAPADCVKQNGNPRPAEDALKYDLAQKKAALLIISQWCDRGLKDCIRKHDMNEVFLWIRKLAKEEMGKDYDTDR